MALCSWVSTMQCRLICFWLSFSVDETNPWRRHDMETLSELLALCEGNLPVVGGFSSHRAIKAGFSVFVGYVNLIIEQTVELQVIWDTTPLMGHRRNVVYITMTSHKCHELSNHWHVDCLFNSYFRLTTKKHQTLHYWPCVKRLHVDVSGGFPQNWPELKRKSFPCHDVIMVDFFQFMS